MKTYVLAICNAYSSESKHTVVCSIPLSWKKSDSPKPPVTGIEPPTDNGSSEQNRALEIKNRSLFN